MYSEELRSFGLLGRAVLSRAFEESRALLCLFISS